MRDIPTEADARRALHEHLVDKARLARARYGPAVDRAALTRLLADPEFVRYPTSLRVSTEGLEPGEFAAAIPLGEAPADGFCIVVHPLAALDESRAVMAAAYQVPPINYGDLAGPEDCEQFGAALLGMRADAYYDALCALADSMPGATGGSP